MRKVELLEMLKPDIIKIVKAVTKQLIAEAFDDRVITKVIDQLAEERIKTRLGSRSKGKVIKEEVEEEEVEVLGDILPKSRKVNSSFPGKKVSVKTSPKVSSRVGEGSNPYQEFSHGPVTIESLIESAVDGEELIKNRVNEHHKNIIQSPLQKLEEVNERDVNALESVDYSAFVGDKKEISKEDLEIEEKRREILRKFGGKSEIKVISA